MGATLVRNMSMMSRHHATVRPVEIRPATVGAAASGCVLVDLGPEARRQRSPAGLAAWLLDRLGERRSSTPVEALRERIERETAARALAGCAVVLPARRSSDEDDEGRKLEQPRRMTDLALALVLLSKASDVVWVARKTPVLDRETLGRRLLTRDPRFLGGKP